MCSSRRGAKSCVPQIYSPLQHVVPANTLGHQPQTDLQSQESSKILTHTHTYVQNYILGSSVYSSKYIMSVLIYYYFKLILTD